MEICNNFDAKGQIVYIEPKWETGETCLINIKDPLIYAQAKAKLTKIRREFILKLEEEGFIITYEKTKDKDIVYLIMDDSSICDTNQTIDIYKKEFDKKMFKAGGNKLNYPYTLTVEEYFKNPFFPAVFKYELVNGGVDKFLIETKEQLEIIKKFYHDFSNNKEYKDAFSCSIFQQYIETPTKYQTYMRVLMSASGDLMGASLKYSKIEEKKRNPQGIFEKYFWNKNSQYFLNCNGMFNYYSEGGNILFCQPRYSSEKQEILEEHGIECDNIKVPEEVLEVASMIVQKCNRELGIMCGIDFILNKKDNKWYYLENQAFPAIEEWAATKDIKTVNVKNVNDYIKYCAQELEARHDALMMYMNKKSSEKQLEKHKRLKFIR